MKDNKTMRIETAKGIIDELLPLYEEACRLPFPYEGSRKLLQQSDGQYKGLVPSLDTYFSDIAGYCSWGERILKWQREKAEEAKEKLQSSFFEKYPEYKPLESMITESNTFDLFTSLALYEKMRTKLLRVLSHLLVEQ